MADDQESEEKALTRERRTRGTTLAIRFRLRWVEEQMIQQVPYRKLVGEIMRKYKLSERSGQAMISRINAEWRKEEAEERPARRAAMRKFLWTLVDKEVKARAWGAVNDTIEKICKLDGLFVTAAPEVTVAAARGPGSTSAEERQQLEVLLTEELRERGMGLVVVESPNNPGVADQYRVTPLPGVVEVHARSASR